MIDGGHRDAFHPDGPDPAYPECIRRAVNSPERSAQGEDHHRRPPQPPNIAEIAVERHVREEFGYRVVVRVADPGGYVETRHVWGGCDRDQARAAQEIAYKTLGAVLQLTRVRIERPAP
jgi:hypothetical protein